MRVPFWFYLVVGLMTASMAGCASKAQGNRPGMKISEPDAAFLKRVEKDRFPRAGQNGLTSAP